MFCFAGSHSLAEEFRKTALGVGRSGLQPKGVLGDQGFLWSTGYWARWFFFRSPLFLARPSHSHAQRLAASRVRRLHPFFGSKHRSDSRRSPQHGFRGSQPVERSLRTPVICFLRRGCLVQARICLAKGRPLDLELQTFFLPNFSQRRWQEGCTPHCVEQHVPGTPSCQVCKPPHCHIWFLEKAMQLPACFALAKVPMTPANGKGFLSGSRLAPERSHPFLCHGSSVQVCARRNSS